MSWYMRLTLKQNFGQVKYNLFLVQNITFLKCCHFFGVFFYLIVASTHVTNILCLSVLEMAPTGQTPLLKDILGTRMMIMWEEQLVDPPIAYIPVFCFRLHARLFSSCPMGMPSSTEPSSSPCSWKAGSESTKIM